MDSLKVILDVDIMWGYSRGLMRGIIRYSDEHGPWSFYSSPGKRERVFPHLEKWECDGIVISDLSYKRNQKHIPSHVPIVSICEKAQCGHVSIAPDSLKAGQVGADYLMGLGFKNFAFCSFRDRTWSKEREESFTKHLSNAGYKAHLYRYIDSFYFRSFF